MWSKRSETELNFPDLSCEIRDKRTSIPTSTVVFFPLKNAFKQGLIPSIISLCFNCFSILCNTLRFERSSASTGGFYIANA